MAFQLFRHGRLKRIYYLELPTMIQHPGSLRDDGMDNADGVDNADSVDGILAFVNGHKQECHPWHEKGLIDRVDTIAEIDGICFNPFGDHNTTGNRQFRTDIRVHDHIVDDHRSIFHRHGAGRG